MLSLATLGFRLMTDVHVLEGRYQFDVAVPKDGTTASLYDLTCKQVGCFEDSMLVVFSVVSF